MSEPAQAPRRGAPLVLPADLPSALAPLVWLIGTWEGVGVAVRRDQQTGDQNEYQFGQRLSFTFDGRDFLAYTSLVWRLDEHGHLDVLEDQESGFWRSGGEPGQVEVVLANAQGYVEVYVGTGSGPRLEVVSDMVGRSATAPAYTAGKRLYGLVEGDLLYAHDAAFATQGDDERSSSGLAPLRSARLKRTSHAGDTVDPLQLDEQASDE